MNKLLVLLAFLLVLCGCSKESEKIEIMLEQANATMNAQPDLALKLLEQQDASSIKRPEQKAKYQVLLTRALDKTDHIFTNDSTIAPAASYYLHHGSEADRAEAFFYMSRVNRYINSNPDEVMQWLIKAEKHVANTNNSYLKALIHFDKAHLLAMQMNHKESIEVYEMAKTILYELGLKRNAMGCLECIAYQHYLLNNNSRALDNYKEALSLAKELKDTSFILQYSHDIIKTEYEIDKNPNNTLKQLHRVYNTYNKGEIPNYCYGMLANMHISIKQYDSARVYTNEYLEHNGSGSYAYYLLSLVEEACGNYKKALEYDRLQVEVTDSLYQVEKDNMVQELEQKYKNKELLAENQKIAENIRINRAIYLLMVAVMALALTLSTVLFRRRITFQKQKIDQMQELTNSLLQNQQELQQANTSLCDRLNSQEEKTVRLSDALQRKFNNIKGLLAKASLMENSGYRFMQEFHNFLRIDAREAEQAFSDLIDVVNLNFRGFASVLAQRHPALSKDDIRFCCLICLGYSTNNIRFIYGLKHPNSVYVKRASIRNSLNLTGEKESLEAYIANLLRELDVPNILVVGKEEE